MGVQKASCWASSILNDGSSDWARLQSVVKVFTSEAGFVA